MTDENSKPNGRSGALLALVVRASAVGVLVASGVVLLGRWVDPAAWLTPDGLRTAVGADRRFPRETAVLVVPAVLALESTT